MVFHCGGGKDRTGLLALVLLTLAGAPPEEIIADYLLTYDRLKQRYDEIGVRDQLTAVTELRGGLPLNTPGGKGRRRVRRPVGGRGGGHRVPAADAERSALAPSRATPAVIYRDGPLPGR